MIWDIICNSPKAVETVILSAQSVHSIWRECDKSFSFLVLNNETNAVRPSSFDDIISLVRSVGNN